MNDDIRTIERLVAVETRLDEALALLRESRDHQQKTMGLVDAVQAVDRRTIGNEQAIRAIYSKIDPMIHSSPPVGTRLKTLEDSMLMFSTRVKVMATIATFVSPLMTALAVFYITSGR